MEFVAIFFVELVFLYLLARNLHVGFGRLFYKITRREKWAVYLLAVLFLPGTFVHEISHFLTALLLIVPVGQVELMPEIQEGGVKLGSVPIGKTDPIRRFLIGIAPLVLGTTLILLTAYFFWTGQFDRKWWHFLIAAYLFFEVGNTMFMSKRDLAGAWKLVLVFVVAAIASYFLGIRLSPSSEFVEVIKRADIFLAIPIIIDLVFVISFKYFKLI